jgi:hypothetical protein
MAIQNGETGGKTSENQHKDSAKKLKNKNVLLETRVLPFK